MGSPPLRRPPHPAWSSSRPAATPAIHEELKHVESGKRGKLGESALCFSAFGRKAAEQALISISLGSSLTLTPCVAGFSSSSPNAWLCVLGFFLFTIFGQQMDVCRELKGSESYKWLTFSVTLALIHSEHPCRQMAALTSAYLSIGGTPAPQVLRSCH